MEHHGAVQDVREVAGREVPVSAKPATPQAEEPSAAHDELLMLLEDEGISEKGFLRWANAQPTSPQGGYPSYFAIPEGKIAGLPKVWKERSAGIANWIRLNYNK